MQAHADFARQIDLEPGEFVIGIEEVERRPRAFAGNHQGRFFGPGGRHAKRHNGNDKDAEKTGQSYHGRKVGRQEDRRRLVAIIFDRPATTT